MGKKTIRIISGGTMSHIAPHLSLCAPAYGTTGQQLKELCIDLIPDLHAWLHQSRMTGEGSLETNADVADLVADLKDDPATKIVFMPVALCDFDVVEIERSWRDKARGRLIEQLPIGKNAPRLETSKCMPEIDDGSDYGVKGTVYPNLHFALVPAPKILPTIRDGRKDIFLVGFKTTTNATEDQQYIAGLNLLKASSCNLVLANDIKTHLNMVITPEEARYHVTTDRDAALLGLVEMTALRSHLTFTRSTVIAGASVPWSSSEVPPSLRAVVDHCIKAGAYKPFRGATVGHFAVKLSDTEFLTSKRKTNFNDLAKIGLVRVKTDGPDTVLAYGAKPSVGGQSQRIVFEEHPGYDCIVHAHVPLKPGVTDIPVVSQREYECGSHECGRNTSRGLKDFGGFYAVMLDQHGPNIVFPRSIDPERIIKFIDDHFDLSAKTGGYVS